jgi:hypothetical protein
MNRAISLDEKTALERLHNAIEDVRKDKFGGVIVKNVTENMIKTIKEIENIKGEL